MESSLIDSFLEAASPVPEHLLVLGVKSLWLIPILVKFDTDYPFIRFLNEGIDYIKEHKKPGFEGEFCYFLDFVPAVILSGGDGT